MWIDISPLFHNGMPNWPGDTPFNVQRVAQIGPDCVVNVSQLTLSAHTGSHIDAPLHYRADGASIADLPLDRFIGPCHVVDARTAQGPLLLPQDVLPALEAQRLQHAADPSAAFWPRILIRQYDHAPTGFDNQLKGLSVALVEALAARGVKLIGTDAASVDPATSKTLDAHHAIDRAGMLILEGLVLHAAPPGPYDLIALPLAIAGADASPVRAVLRPLGAGQHEPKKA